MDIKELDHLASQNNKMPSLLPIHEQSYYIAVRGSYQQFNAGMITK